MKLASLKGGRDGRLVVVSDDLAWHAPADAIAPTLQAALEDWGRCEPMLRGLAQTLEHGGVPRERFHEHEAASPLPRAYQRAEGLAYLDAVALVRKAQGLETPESWWAAPPMRQCGSDGFLAPRDPIGLADESLGLDLEAGLAVITGDTPRGVSREEGLAAVRLVMLCNEVSLRSLAPGEIATSCGFFQSRPAAAFSPVAVTPDSLQCWRDGKLYSALEVELNGKPLGHADAGVDMTFDFGALVAHAARTRDLGAGAIIGSGAVSNRGPDGGPGRPIGEGGAGYSCLAQLRAVETLVHGAARTPFLKAKDVVRVEMRDARRHTIFGAVEQAVRGS